MDRVINDMSGNPIFAAEVDGELCITSGYDRPRFASPSAGISGYLGYQVWADDEYKPTLNSTTTGTLTAGEYYSIRLVPISQYIVHQASFASGTPSPAADFQTGSTGYIFDLVQHPEQISFDTGVSTAYSTTTVTDDTKAWAVDQWAGYTLISRTDGSETTISSNTADTLTFADDIFTATGEAFSIVGPKTTGYYVYAANTPTSDTTGAQWLLQEIIDYGTTTYTLDSFVQGQSMVEDEYFGPENFKLCVEGKGRLFAGGGIVETRGKATTFPVAALPMRDSSDTVMQDSEPKDMYARSALAPEGYDVYGNTSGAEQTYFTEGMVGASIQFEGDVKSYIITEVNEYEQTLKVDGYDGSVYDIDTSFIITSDFELWYSDVKNPHIFRTGNFVEIPDRIEGLAELGGMILCFCASSLYAVPIDNLGQEPRRLQENISFNAPYSPVKTPKGIMYYDGEDFSLTDGVNTTSVSKYKASDYLAKINRDMTHNIRGVYNPKGRRVEYYFAYGNEITNNYGLNITIDSLNCYGTSRVDCNAVWLDKEGTDPLRVHHGTSGRHTAKGVGDIWKHDESLATDGDLDNTAYFFTITAVDTVTRTISVQSLSGETAAFSGWSILHVSSANPVYQQVMIDTITSTGTGPQTYDIVVGEDWDINQFAANDYMIAGGVPFTFGPVWTDFGSPVYQKHVRGLQIDGNGFEGLMFVDHYLDGKETSPVSTNVLYLTTEDTHIPIDFRGGSGNSYGFRLRGYAVTPGQLNSISRIFDTEV